jgi:hypothetical protein
VVLPKLLEEQWVMIFVVWNYCLISLIFDG